jgi:NAD(P)-dependent dehydrogenase (short-subunit alcohol dehydrogenase family)
VARLDSKVVFVTGAAGGIGGAVVTRFLAEGAQVAAADLDAATVEKVMSDLGGVGDRLLALSCDVSDGGQVQQSIARAVAEFGRLDVLCNTAGGSSVRDGRVTEAPEEEFWRVIGTDLFGTFLVCKHGIPELVKAGGGAVINLTSMAALMALPERDCYTAAKGGVAAMTRSMASGYGPESVRINAIAPGITMTPRVAARAHTERQQRLAARHLLGVLESDDIADMALFLASDESRHITGQVLAVDSGVTIT